MKVALILLICVVFGASASSYQQQHQYKFQSSGGEFLQKQRFLFEIVHRIEDPLMFEEWIRFAKDLIFDKDQYLEFDHSMIKFYEAYQMKALLPKSEFFGALAKTHMQQAMGLFSFLYYASSWDTFLRNVCWARVHVNEGMFVYALTLAVNHRADLNGLMLPSIYEIFPQHFFHEKFIFRAEKFDFDVWSNYIMYEKEFKDIYHKDMNDSHVYMKDWKMWQWWKMMGLDEKFYMLDFTKGYEQLDTNNMNVVNMQAMRDLRVFWMPVDYTRDLEFYNDHSKLCYFMEDVDWNAYWYYLNIDYTGIMRDKATGLDKSRHVEWWFHNLHQMMARYYMERLSQGFGEIDTFSWLKPVSTGYDSQLLAYNGVGFSYRKNFWEVLSQGNMDLANQLANFEQRLNDILDAGFYQLPDGTKIDFRQPGSIKYINEVMQGSLNEFDHRFLTYYNMLSSMYFGNVDENDIEVFPNIFMNFETMVRDPMFYMYYKKIVNFFQRFQKYLTPYTQKDLHFRGVRIRDVRIDNLVTFYDLSSFDVTNLLNDKMKFNRGKLVWDTMLMARQMRLNHKPFNLELMVDSYRDQKAIVRIFLGPKFDEYGRLLSLAENRENFMKLDEFTAELNVGKNIIKRNSSELRWTTGDRTTYTEQYRRLMLAIDGEYDYRMEMSQSRSHCNFPDRLLLPKGSENGMPMQMMFMVTPYKGQGSELDTEHKSNFCHIEFNTRLMDNMSFGYPFDRVINEYDFIVPNMFFKDVKIYHEDKFEKYLEQSEEHFGSVHDDF